MAEAAILRALRFGTPEGEFALAAMVGDSLETACGKCIFNHFVRGLMSAIVSGTAQARGLVMVASVYSPDDYSNLLDSKFYDRIQFVDLFTDPLGWNKACSSCQNVHDLRLLVTEAGKVKLGLYAGDLVNLQFLWRANSKHDLQLHLIRSVLC